ncbi:MAG: hypothetical protein LIO90_04755 [Bacteroidales bacterium]|nr:hypothetical protein [Bacteroidales bacterium]
MAVRRITNNNGGEAAEPQHPHRRGAWIARLIHGQLISSDFFSRNWLAIFAACILMLLYITNKYNCQTKMEEIRRLNKELEIVKTERIRVRSIYMSRIRESSMQELIDSLHLNLHVQEQPPYRLPSR